jgi:hypothetical protein
MVKKRARTREREREKLMGIIVEPHLGFKFMKMSSYTSDSMPSLYVARQKTFPKSSYFFLSGQKIVRNETNYAYT